MDHEMLLIMTNAPDRDVALRMARELVERKLAACVNVLGGCTSIYAWKGAIEQADEVPVLVKARAACYPEVEAVMRSMHPYEVPEIVAIPVTAALPDYLDWVVSETTIEIG